MPIPYRYFVFPSVLPSFPAGSSHPPIPCRLTSTQFSIAELTAIVEEAQATGTYVCAHAYTPAAIERAVRCGVRR